MGNKVQLFFYRLSNFAPLCFIFAIAWAIQEKTWVIPLLATMFGAVFLLMFFLSFKIIKEQIPNMPIGITEASPGDKEIVSSLFSYAIPLISFVFEEINIIVAGIAAILALIAILATNSATPNILLLFKGYHFYVVNVNTGISGYMLITKKKLRKSKDVTSVKRIFDYLILEE